MRGNVVMIVISLLVLVAGILLLGWVQMTTGELSDLRNEVETRIESGDDGAGNAIRKLQEKWWGDMVFWQCVTTHEEVQHVTELIELMSHSYQQGDTPQTLLYCHLLQEAFDALQARELPTPDNIL